MTIEPEDCPDCGARNTDDAGDLQRYACGSVYILGRRTDDLKKRPDACEEIELMARAGAMLDNQLEEANEKIALLERQLAAMINEYKARDPTPESADEKPAARLVIVESPYAGDNDWAIEENMRYLRAAMRDCLLRGEAPFASHGLYTQPGVLRDEVPEEREHGIAAGFAWRRAASATVVYTDLGISFGMQYGIDDAEERGTTIEHRSLPGWEEKAEIDPVASAEVFERLVAEGKIETQITEGGPLPAGCLTCGATPIFDVQAVVIEKGETVEGSWLTCRDHLIDHVPENCPSEIFPVSSEPETPEDIPF